MDPWQAPPLLPPSSAEEASSAWGGTGPPSPTVQVGFPSLPISLSSTPSLSPLCRSGLGAPPSLGPPRSGARRQISATTADALGSSASSGGVRRQRPMRPTRDDDYNEHVRGESGAPGSIGCRSMVAGLIRLGNGLDWAC
jgi:hypothetical protein